MSERGLTDWRLAEALAIQQVHGNRAALWVAERRGTLLLAGDIAASNDLARSLRSLMTCTPRNADRQRAAEPDARFGQFD